MEKQRYAVVIETGEDGYIVARVPALRGVWSQGKSRAEALDNVREAIALHLEMLRTHNETIPQQDDELVEVMA